MWDMFLKSEGHELLNSDMCCNQYGHHMYTRTSHVHKDITLTLSRFYHLPYIVFQFITLELSKLLVERWSIVKKFFLQIELNMYQLKLKSLL